MAKTAQAEKDPYAPRNEDTMGKKPATVFVCQECGTSPQMDGAMHLRRLEFYGRGKVLPASAEDKQRRAARAGRPRLSNCPM